MTDDDDDHDTLPTAVEAFLWAVLVAFGVAVAVKTTLMVTAC